MVDVKISEAKLFYGFQLMIENVHSETYTMLLETLIQDEKKINHYINAIENIPCIKKKADWAIKWIDKQIAFPIRLIAFAVVEGIFFSGSFASIFWLKNKLLFPGLTLSNEYISRDEGLHCTFAYSLYKYIVQKIPNELILKIVKEAVELEKEFLIDAIPVDLLGMNNRDMSQYIEYVADYLLQELNCPKYYKVENPFSFMNRISLESRTNFYEKKVTEYQKAKVMVDKEENKINFNSTF